MISPFAVSSANDATMSAASARSISTPCSTITRPFAAISRAAIRPIRSLFAAPVGRSACVSGSFSSSDTGISMYSSVPQSR